MKIHGIAVMKDEESRYLKSCLEWNSGFIDDLFIYDDRSSDNSVEIAEEYGVVAVRSMNEPSFMEHEGRFRQAAWESFEATMKPSLGDFCLSFDLDEFLTLRHTSDPEAVRGVLDNITSRSGGYISQEIPFAEVFDVSASGQPFVRTDGFWGKIRASRFFAYKPDGRFADLPMGCGSVPMYVVHGSTISSSKDLTFLHYGYAVFEDRADKYDRYTSLEENGHSSQHIQSILTKPELAKWTGPHPDLV
jgi:hypothetical protein